ncbi:hypothetical protein GT204_34540 [Streptomyces sp. SID4919]|uniref:hypothetical protein n=1 Tax=unclassified Streptomyces TaxID=2593676 RepID=UPI000823C9F9|nr:MULTISPECIES: hypothetical protein [unclassified Streptomyces]MYY13847.1 hypothetical protein [Streptomyces sp. SID4919]SCK30916.1 hypothetical protein YW7DRAFT_02433 [Streptomyces sp. AmelKG-E11A]
MEQIERPSPLKELAQRIECHNEALRRARGLWNEAEQASRQIGHLVGLAMAAGTSWAELGRLLATAEEAPVPPGLGLQGAASGRPAPRAGENPLRQGATAPGAGPRAAEGELSQIPPQNERPHQEERPQLVL